MKVFLSYSSSQLDLAARLAYSMKDEGDLVFFDRESLPPGVTYDARIRESIEASDVFVFLVSPDSISPGSYALAELGMAERASRLSVLRLMPVMAAVTDFAALPANLRSITILQPKGDIVAETMMALAGLRRDLQRRQVSASLMVSSSGWMVTFHILDDPPKEFFYRLSQAGDFTSTGFSRTPGRTGLPQARLFATLKPFAGVRNIQVKWLDSRGREHGPYNLAINATEQLVASAKDILEMTRPWLAFREYPEGTMLLYFTHLLSYKTVLKEIQYSVDNDTLSNRVRFQPRDPATGSYEIDPDDEVLIEVPMETGYVSVKLVFIDGSEWPAERVERT